MIDYFKPGEIRSYSREQAMWMLNNCLEGWPAQDSNYTDPLVSHSASSHMPGETAILVIAELTCRISTCGEAGKRLYKNLFAIVARNHGRPAAFEDLPYESQQVVNYVCGVCRRSQDCGPCPRKTCKKRGRKACTFSQWVNHNR